MLTCPKCGHDNELGRIFCHQCGTKLDLNQIKPPGRGGKKIQRRDTPGVGRVFLRIVEVAALVAVIWTIFLACQVPDVRPVASTEQDQISVQKKRIALERAMDERKPATIQLSETELNAFVDRLGFEKGEGKGLRIVPSSLQIELEDGVVKLIMLGTLELGSAIQKKIYIQYRGVPVIEGGAMVFKPASAQFGGLPIHPRLLGSTGFIQRYFSEVFRNLQIEQQLLNRLTSIAVDARRVLLNYQPAPPAPDTATPPAAAPSAPQLPATE
jgi:hypothetical protein